MYVFNTLPFNKPERNLQTLYTLFQRENRVVLSGENGAGKTTLAREYMRRFAGEYQAAIRINAATDETFLADLYAALQKFSLPVDMTRGVMGLFQTLHHYLNEQQKALLVLDHLPFPFVVQDSPDQQPLRYHFLLVTHLAKTPPELPRLELAGLEAQEGALLVLRQAGLLAEQGTLDTLEDDLRREAQELARELQGSPLALHLAGGYIHQTGCSFRDYLDLFREYPLHLQLPAGENKDDQQALAVAGEISLSWIERMCPEVLECLRVCALLLPEAIPEALLQQESAGEEEQKETIQILLAAGLLDANEDRSMLSMHPLIQQLARQFCQLNEEPQRQQQVEQVLRRLLLLLPTLEKEALPTRLRAAGHIRHLAELSKQWMLTASEAAEAFGWAATLLWEQNMLSQAEELLRKALAIWEEAPEISQLTIATALEKLAVLNGQLGNYAEAEALSLRAITSTLTTKGVNHPDVLLVLDQLGQYYAAQHKRNEARACYEKVIEVAEMLKLRQHPVYSAAKYHLALLSIEQGSLARAEDLLLRVCTVREHVLGKNDRSALEARLKLAEVAARLQHWKRANSCYRQALPVYEELLGSENPLILEHQERAAMALFRVGKLAEAKGIWQRVLETRERNRSGSRSASASCLNGLARIALTEKKNAEALALLARAQSLFADQEEAESLMQAETLEMLAEAHKAVQEYGQAIQAARQALEVRERLLGAEHLELTESLDQLAKLLLEQGQTEEAEKLLLRALYNCQQEQKVEDMRLDPVFIGLAEIETGRKHFDNARMYLQRAQNIRGAALGKDDPHTLEIEQKLVENRQMQEL